MVCVSRVEYVLGGFKHLWFRGCSCWCKGVNIFVRVTCRVGVTSRVGVMCRVGVTCRVGV